MAVKIDVVCHKHVSLPDLFMLSKCAAVGECTNMVNTFIAMASKAHNAQEETAICSFPGTYWLNIFLFLYHNWGIKYSSLFCHFILYKTSFLRGGPGSFGQRLISLIVKAKRMDFFTQFFLLLKILG